MLKHINLPVVKIPLRTLQDIFSKSRQSDLSMHVAVSCESHFFRVNIARVYRVNNVIFQAVAKKVFSLTFSARHSHLCFVLSLPPLSESTDMDHRCDFTHTFIPNLRDLIIMRLIPCQTCYAHASVTPQFPFNSC